jgi:DNA-binding beta-propeller fold protein YncE
MNTKHLIMAAAAILVLASCRSSPETHPSISSTERVGSAGTNRYVTPVNQILTPAGLQVDLPGMRPQALAISPDGRLLVTSGKTHELVVIDPQTGSIRQRVALPSEKTNEPAPDPVSPQILAPDKEGQLSFTGLIFSPDGTRIYLSNVNGSIKVFIVDKEKISGSHSIPLPPADAPNRKVEIPSGLALSPDGKRLYVVLNLSNRLAEIDAASGKVLRFWDVGVAPYEVVLTHDKAYVSNWGGRRPDAHSLTGPAGQGTLVRVDPIRHIANEGSVSVIDLKAGKVIGTSVICSWPTRAAIPSASWIHARTRWLKPFGRSRARRTYLEPARMPWPLTVLEKRSSSATEPKTRSR